MNNPHLVTTVRPPGLHTTIAKRECVSHASINLLEGFNEWHRWTVVIHPTVSGVWFSRPDNYDERASIKCISTLDLPTGRLGVYEIGITPPHRHNDEHIICIYAGRARSTKNHIRKRLSEYIKGDDQANELRYYLALGCQVWIRWALCLSAQLSKRQEDAMLSSQCC